MTAIRLTTIGAIALVVALAWGCGPRRVATPSARPELIVLLSERGDSPGRAMVSNSAGSVDLVADRESTVVMQNQPPRAPSTLPESQILATFGDALAAQPPPPEVFTVYFLFESDELTPESRASVPTIFDAVRARPIPEVVVTGHTDTTGTSESNFMLGNRRATTVRALLIEAGLDAGLIQVMSLGETDLLVPTADDVAEPRNRRVEITVQ